MTEDGPTWQMVTAEHADFIGLARSLTPQQWDAASLCEGWTVRDVLIHAGWDGGWADLARLARCGFSIHRLNDWVIRHNRNRTPESLTNALAGLDFTTAQARMLGTRNCLRAMMIHQQDVRRPLHMPRQIPPDRLRVVLNVITKRSGSVNLGSQRRAEGLHLIATDIDWERGSGRDVSGPAEALIMAISGRGVALSDLSGDGLGLLALRID